LLPSTNEDGGQQQEGQQQQQQQQQRPPPSTKPYSILQFLGRRKASAEQPAPLAAAPTTGNSNSRDTDVAAGEAVAGADGSSSGTIPPSNTGQQAPSSSEQQPVAFNEWSDKNGWIGLDVTGQYMCECWLAYAIASKRWQLQDDLMASITSDMISLDHVMEPAKRVSGCSKALLLVCSKLGEVMFFRGTSTTGLAELVPELTLMRQERYDISGEEVRMSSLSSILENEP